MYCQGDFNLLGFILLETFLEEFLQIPKNSSNVAEARGGKKDLLMCF